MSDPYLWVKWVHILSATILFGTGLGTAFHMYATHLRGDPAAIAAAARNTVLADWLFTTPAAVVQPVSGIFLIVMAGYDPHAPWLMLSYGLYILASACWLRVVFLQFRLRDLAHAAAARGGALPPAYHAAMRQWFWLGWPAFISFLLIFALMVMKPDF